ncbi:hypothetical protein GGX14DRAFT_623481 [Mycena pura]|uniref:Uncharacterized protein n=1 Tax=Mycena pura TaxID=153505 RepID=A0AAD6VK00_9AGAR|nr:hypothetical protein GGX14DRAFT_623481 [Mycena pura]
MRHHDAATRDVQGLCRGEVRGHTGACMGSGGRFRAVAARGVENEPAHGRRHGASQDGGGVENEPARGVSGRRRCSALAQGVAAAGGVRRRCRAAVVRGGRCSGGHQKRACARSTERARAVQGGGVGEGSGVGHRRAAVASKRSQRACAGALQGVGGTGGVENESTHAHGGVRRALQGGGGAGRRKRATHTQQSVRGRQHKYGGRKVYEKLAFQQRDIDNDAPRKSQLVTEPLADAWADALSRGSPRIA